MASGRRPLLTGGAKRLGQLNIKNTGNLPSVAIGMKACPVLSRSFSASWGQK